MIEAHTLIAELAGFINRWPVGPNRDTWKRFRLAVTEEELTAIVEWYRKDNADTDINVIAFALRGVPLIVDTNPTEPMIIMVPK